MNNVLLLYESYEPTNAEVYKLLKLAEDKNAINLRKCVCTKVCAEDIDWCDLVLSVRSTSALEWRLAKYAKKLGKYWVLMLDDDFLSLDGSYGKDGQGYRNEKKTSLKRMLQYTDCLLAVNKLLAEKYAKIGNIPKYVLTNTPFDCSKFVTPGNDNEKTKLVFYVNDGTQLMFNQYLLPIFPKLCEDYSDKVAIYFLAVKPDLREYEDKLEIHYVPHMSFEDFLVYIANEHFDIGLAPLDEEGFSKYKYFNKYVEYTRAGIAGIYTDCSLYRQVIEPGFNGLLCKNSVDSWMNSISQLINNPQQRIRIAENAQQYAKDNFNNENVIHKLLHDIPELGNFHSPDRKASAIKIRLIKTHYWAFRIRGWIYTAYSCIRSGNTKSLVNRVMSRLRKTV